MKNQIHDNEKYFQESIADAEKPQKKSQNEKQIFDAVKVFETDVIESKQKRIGFLTKINIFQGVTIVLLAGALIGLTPLKTVEPFLLRVDNTTGYVDKVNPYEVKGNTVNEAVQRYFLARFIENREGYEWFTVQDMYNFVEATSNKAVFDAYKNYMISNQSPVKVLSNRMKMLVKVNGITFLDDSTAQIRFTKLITEPDGKAAVGYIPTKWIATLKFDFSKKITTEQERLLNPLGLNVISYRVDAEVVK
ncbi:virB8 family protein [Providencia huaxiensis]|uniref:virB8 family protein n=1 Tax=Providencia huaxiensis TaxID=2027290 RepID=UPI000C7EF5A1|nr:type IV secretion system protein [Providencia huaxiensis]AXH60554.1 type IV secretion system protein [Providencia huaxiensis]EEB1245424.1 hypothetical protein [Salmonella enterica]